MIAALLQLLQSLDVDDENCTWVPHSLGLIGIGNENAIAALVQLLQSNHVDYFTSERAADILGTILQNNKHRFAVVKVLSGDWHWELDFVYYKVAWKCPQNMPYLDFYQAWHQHNVATLSIRTLKNILFTRF